MLLRLRLLTGTVVSSLLLLVMLCLGSQNLNQREQLQAGGLSASDAARELASRSGHSRRELYALLHSAAN